jgi:poly-gamma-glutamate capsule biosynthesis protein CapA/YwtB (metallophosphatase superfamily)
MLYEEEKGDMKIALGGDCALTRRLSVFQEKQYLELRNILHEADVRFVNLESAVHEFLEGHQNIAEGTYVTTEPFLLDELKWLGVNMVSTAGSHSYDYGEEGIIKSMQYLKQSGILQAGIGRHLREARSPVYLDTTKGRVALIAVSAHAPEWTIAGEQRPDTLGRPGVNPLRFKTVYVVDKETLENLKKLGKQLGIEAEKIRRMNQGFPIPEEPANQHTFLGYKFIQGDDTAVKTMPNEKDVLGNIKQIAEAKYMSDLVICSLHYHEMGGPKLLTAQLRSEIDEPADFVKIFAHRCIDEGADIFVGHGPQSPYGIEIYKGKPIFYSLGSFIFQCEVMRYLPEEAYSRYNLTHNDSPADFIKARYQNDTKGHPTDPLQWQQILACCSFKSKILDEIILYPLDLGYGKPRTQRGRPLLANQEMGERIIDRVNSISKKYGTKINFTKGAGIIRL